MNNNPNKQSLAAQALSQYHLTQQQQANLRNQAVAMQNAGLMPLSSANSAHQHSVTMTWSSLLTKLSAMHGGLYRINHRSDHYTIDQDAANSTWSRTFIIFKRSFTEVRIPTTTSEYGSQTEFNDEAIGLLEAAAQHKSWLAPLHYDAINHQWVVAFGKKSDAMVFKLANGGAV